MQPWILVALALAIIVMVTCQWQLSSKARIKRFLKKHCGIKKWPSEWPEPTKMYHAWYRSNDDLTIRSRTWRDFCKLLTADRKSTFKSVSGLWFAGVYCKASGGSEIRFFAHDPQDYWVLYGKHDNGYISGCMFDKVGFRLDLPACTTIDDLAGVISETNSYWELVGTRGFKAIAEALSETKHISTADAFRDIRLFAEMSPGAKFYDTLHPTIAIPGPRRAAT